MKAKKCVLAGILASAMLCQSVFAPGLAWVGQDVSRVQAAENVALNKPVTVSALEQEGQYTGELAVDGISDTDVSRWSGGQMKDNSGTDLSDQWLTIDLRAQKTTVESIHIWFFKLVWSTKYVIQTSATGADGTWENVHTVTNEAGSTQNLENSITSSQVPELKRYVRFYFETLNTQAGGNAISVREISIMGTQEGVINDISNASEALGTISELTVSAEDTALQIPQVEGYEIKVHGSEVDKVLGDDGTIAPLRINDRSMNVIVQATSLTNASDTAKKNFTVTVPANRERYAQLFPSVSSPNPEPSVLPTIQEWYGYEGDFTVGEGTQIVYNDAANLGLAEVAKEMQEDLTEICGFTPEVKAGTAGDGDDIYLESLAADTYGTGDEGYLMVTDDNGIRILSAAKTGIIYGTVTAEQILYQDAARRSVPKGVIRDYPLYGVRGVMFDVARIPTRMQFLEDYTKIAKWFKLNEMHIHLNDCQWSMPEKNSENYTDWEKVEASHRLESDLFPSLAKQDSKFERQDAFTGWTGNGNEQFAGDYEGRYDYYYNVHTGTKEKTGEAGELYYTKEEFRQLQKDGEKRGVQVVAELDTPGHSAPYTKYVHDNQTEVITSLVEHGYLDEAEYLNDDGSVKKNFYIHHTGNYELLAIDDQSTNAAMKENAENAKIFMTALFDEYLGGEDPVFTSAAVSAGVDEYWDNTAANQSAFRRYMNYMYELIHGKYGKEVRMWGGLKLMGGSADVNRDIVLEEWNSRYDDDAMARLADGFSVINVPQTYLYTTPGRYHKDMPNENYLFYNWDPTIFDGNNPTDKGNPQLLGAKAALWGDANRSGTTEADLHERYQRLCAMVGEKTWGGTKADATFLEYSRKFNSVKDGPDTQIANKIESKTNVVLDYDFENVSKDGKTVYDASGNGYDGTITNGTVTEQAGEKMLKFSGDTTIETPLQTLGYPYTMSFDVYLDGTENNTKESSLFSGYDGRLQIAGMNGSMSLNRDFYTQSFDYTVESTQKHRVTIVGTYEATKLYVDGEFQKILYAAARDTDNGGNRGTEVWSDKDNNYRTTFVFPLNVIGKDFSGYLGNIKAYNKALTKEELAADGAQSTETDVARNRNAYADNKNSTYQSDLLRLYPAWKATDGDGHVTGAAGASASNESRWNSSDNNGDFLMVDLGENRTVNKVVIEWAANLYAAAYKIQVSEDGETWEDVTNVTGNTAALTTDTFESVTARYVKMQGVQFKSGSSQYGIFEMKVYSSVDKSGLAAEIAKAEAIRDADLIEGGQTVGWDSTGAAKDFHDSVVLAKAVQGDVMAGQEEVTAAVAVLKQAESDWDAAQKAEYEEFQKVQEQKAQMERKAAEAAALLVQKDTYEAASWAKFEAAYNAVKNAAENLSAEEYKTLLNNLDTAMKALVKKTADPTVNPPALTEKALAAPAVKNVKSTATKVTVTWEASANAASYQLYRKVGSAVTKIGAPVTKTTAYDTAPVGGKSMSYYVVALAGNQAAYKDSEAGSAKSITLPKATTKVTAKQQKGKRAVSISWKKVKKATSYLIYRSEGKKGKLKKIAVVKKKTSYIDKKVKSKKTYSYKVVAVSAKKYSPMKAAKKAVKIK